VLPAEVRAIAGIGSRAGAANASLQPQLVGGLGKFVTLINDINQHVRSAVDGYADADAATAQGYGGDAATGGGAAAATPPQLDSRVVDSIMASEGATGEQGGVPEAYGFRQNMHNDYDRIIAAREQYGIGSAVVAELTTERAAGRGVELHRRRRSGRGHVRRAYAGCRRGPGDPERDRCGKGLTERYDREQAEFLDLAAPRD
jgi:hypothetical protein